MALLTRKRGRAPVVSLTAADEQYLQVSGRIESGKVWLARAVVALQRAGQGNGVDPRVVRNWVAALGAMAPPADVVSEEVAQKWDALPADVRQVAIQMYRRRELCCASGLNDFLAAAGLDTYGMRAFEGRRL